MLLLSPFSPFTVAKIAGLQATVLLLITLLIKAQVQIKAASALGFFLLALQTLVFLAAAGALGLVALGEEHGIAEASGLPREDLLRRLLRIRSHSPIPLSSSGVLAATKEGYGFLVRSFCGVPQCLREGLIEGDLLRIE